MTLHCMIDLETLDNVATSKILSLGAVVFNTEGSFLQTFYSVCDLDSQPDRTICHDTLMWWFKQSDQARQAFTGPMVRPRHLREVLMSFNIQLAGHKGIKMWSNGANFDLPMVGQAMRSYGLKPAWAFWDERCHRTVKALYKEQCPEPKREGTYHNALDDAKHQAHHLLAIHRAVGGIL